MNFKNFFIKNTENNYNFLKKKITGIDENGLDGLLRYIKFDFERFDEKKLDIILKKTKINHQDYNKKCGLHYCIINCYTKYLIGHDDNKDYKKKYLYIYKKILERGDNPYLGEKNPEIFLLESGIFPSSEIINIFFDFFIITINKIKINSKIFEYFIEDIYNSISKIHTFELFLTNLDNKEFNNNLDNIIDIYINESSILDLQYTFNINGTKLIFGEFLRKINKYDKIKNYLLNKHKIKLNQDKNISLIIINYFI